MEFDNDDSIDIENFEKDDYKKDEALIVDLNNLLDNSSKKDRNSQNGESD
jgi:hypothetical protein